MPSRRVPIMEHEPMRRTRFPMIEPRVVSDDTTLVYHLRRVRSGGPGLVIVCGASVIGVLEPVTHAVERGMALCPGCDPSS